MKPSSRNVDRIIRNVADLPTLPAAVLHITQIVNNPKASARDLAGIITSDQVLTARLLRLVNSSFYGFPQKISTVTGAIVLLGFDAIRHLLLSTSIFHLFSSPNGDARFHLDAFWDHSLGCALAAKVIGSRMRYEQVEELFVAGLLHDIGKIIEVLYFPDEFQQIAKGVSERNILMLDAEMQILGLSHAEIGAALAEAWRLPPKLIQAVGFHHHPADTEHFRREAAVVHLADILCRALDLGSGGDMRMPCLDAVAWDHLDIEIAALESILDEIDAGFRDLRCAI